MRVKISEPLFTGAGLTFTRQGDLMRFILPERSDVVDVAIVNGELQLVPERSGAHRALIAAIGLEPV
jgi:hypothetical protein